MASVVRDPHTTRVGAPPRPYAPSWLNQVIAQVERVPGPPWIFYVGLWLVLSVVLIAIKWRDGVYPVGTVFPFHIVLALNSFYSVAVAHYALRLAGRTLQEFRPVLTVDEAKYLDLHYRFTTLPARPTLLASLLSLGFILLWLPPSPGASVFAPLLLFTSPLATVVDMGLMLMFWWTVGTDIYAIVYLLRMVRRLYDSYTRVDVLRPGPLYALSKLTAFLAIAISIGTYTWMAFAPEAFSRPSDLSVGVLLPALALTTFIWPLFGLHRQLEQEKARLKDEVAGRLETTFADLHARLADGELKEMDPLNKAISSLTMEEARLAKLPTWPWQPEIPRTVLTVIFLPILLWLIQRILSRIVGL